MNTCDADRVEQIRQAVLEQAHCELPVETIGHAFRRWTAPYLDVNVTINIWIVLIWVLTGMWLVGRKYRHERDDS